ncbi:glycosyltransferase family 4 protein [Streptomyces marispadix]|uniref:Glycosyltransferase family 4 protein n=1 Tax=Streptomyces marispadix TaxID=2922868 RepID=A0ABS9T071_9ACTN|nr:glycosyltransferase family 4 protein [Streptomyces marispadix]MCH6161929.1 glycosyltransferase family 4 protein [Streptomyces marispadix]
MHSQRREETGRLTVLHLAQPVEGGVARVVAELAGAQMRESTRAVVACPEGGSLPRQAAAAGAQVERWPAVRELGPHIAAETLRAGRLVRRVRPDVVHAHSAKAGLAARLALRGAVPTVYQPHAWSFEAVEGATARLARAWERRAARWTDRVLCVSEAERRTGEGAGIAARWSVIHNGVPEAEPCERAAARRELTLLSGVPSDAALVVCVGRLCRQKGQRVLLDAWRHIAEEVPGAWLVLVGDGPDRRELSGSAPRRVLFAGASDEVGRWYAAADLVVLPSRWEGMALTPLEAMACGRPVVVTDVGGARECLPPGQQETSLVPPEDPRALAGAVTHLLREPELRDFLGEAARKHVRADFDVRRTAASVTRLYRELLDTRVRFGTGRAAR